jgi:predicted ester cyclase
MLQEASVSIPQLVEVFYERVWNAGDVEAITDLLSEEFLFRGSLGTELRGRQAFKDYVCSVRNALANYRCEILECVTEGRQAFARMRFSGTHVALFRGYQPTSMPVHWLGAALFLLGANTIAELWVLGDLAGLDTVLEQNQEDALTSQSHHAGG